MTQDWADPVERNLSQSDRLREQMRYDALQPLDSQGREGDLSGPQDSRKESLDTSIVTTEIVEASTEFLRLNVRLLQLVSAACPYSPQRSLKKTHVPMFAQARDRLDRVLTYLRDKHYYCFWCGTKYEDAEDMAGNCPGKDEDQHD